MRFGERLRQIRKQQHISQRDLAAQVGIDFTYLSKIETGHMSPPSEQVIVALAQVLEANRDELMNLAGKVPKDLKGILKENPLASELLRILSERKLPDTTYRQMLALVQETYNNPKNENE